MPRWIESRTSVMTMRIGGEPVCSATISSASSTGMPASRNEESWRENAMTTSGLIGLADAEQRLLDLVGRVGLALSSAVAGSSAAIVVGTAEWLRTATLIVAPWLICGHGSPRHVVDTLHSTRHRTHASELVRTTADAIPRIEDASAGVSDGCRQSDFRNSAVTPVIASNAAT